MDFSEDLHARLADGQRRFEAVEEKLERMLTAVEPIPRMAEQIAETRDLVDAWQAVKTTGKFIKWAGGIIAIVAGAVAAIGKAMGAVLIGLVR